MPFFLFIWLCSQVFLSKSVDVFFLSSIVICSSLIFSLISIHLISSYCSIIFHLFSWRFWFLVSKDQVVFLPNHAYYLFHLFTDYFIGSLSPVPVFLEVLLMHLLITVLSRIFMYSYGVSFLKMIWMAYNISGCGTVY